MMAKGFDAEYYINHLHVSTVSSMDFDCSLAIDPIATSIFGSTASAYYKRVQTTLCIWRILVAANRGELSVLGEYCNLAPYVGLVHAWG